MITQIGSSTFFFTLSAVDTKWHDLHMIMLANVHSNSDNHFQWRIQNIIKNPHLKSQYMHCIFTIEEILQKGLHAIDYWCRYFLIFVSLCINFLHCIYVLTKIYIHIIFGYEWQHRGSAHIHGFLWL